MLDELMQEKKIDSKKKPLYLRVLETAEQETKLEELKMVRN